eukprot:scaffold132402_cov33-Tisochrysis_lutea.AAC.2
MVVVASIAIGEADPGGLVDPEYRCVARPRVWIVDCVQGSAVLYDGARTILVEQREHTGAAWATGEPEDEWVGRRLAA